MPRSFRQALKNCAPFSTPQPRRFPICPSQRWQRLRSRYNFSEDTAKKLEHAFQCLSEGRYAEAERLCRGILNQSPDQSRALYLLGMSCCFTKRYEDAIKALQHATALDPDNVQALYNTGVAYGELRQYQEAAAAYRMTLAKDPHHVFARHNLGTSLAHIGQMEEAIACFKRTLELSPAHDMAADNLVKAQCRLLPMPDWPPLCTKALTEPFLSGDNRYVILVQRAMAEWAAGNLTDLAATLAAAAGARPVARNARLENTRRYEDLLTRLLAYRQSNTHLYGDAENTLFLVGDSHSLSYANIKLTLDGTAYKVASHLIVGAKAWHIGAAIPNPYIVALETCLKSLPKGASLICAFGEIDCRPDHGILPYWRKNGGDLKEIVARQVAQYVASLSVRAMAKSLRLIFLSVPAPHLANKDSREVVALFNAALQQYVREAGHRYIDLYHLTLDKDGCSHERLNLDQVHLKPEALTVAEV